MIDVCISDDDSIDVSDQDADADGSGSVDFTEFVELMIKRESEKETPEDLKQAFRVFDKDGNGFVSTSEIKYVLTRFSINIYLTVFNKTINIGLV